MNIDWHYTGALIGDRHRKIEIAAWPHCNAEANLLSRSGRSIRLTSNGCPPLSTPHHGSITFFLIKTNNDETCSPIQPGSRHTLEPNLDDIETLLAYYWNTFGILLEHYCYIIIGILLEHYWHIIGTLLGYY